MATPVNLCMPYMEPATRVTGRASPGAPVIGKRFVAIAASKDPGSRGLEPDPGGSGGNIRIVGAVANDPRLFGVAEMDCAVGKAVAVLRGKFMLPITAGVALAYGDLVTSGADGRAVVIAAGQRAWGICLGATAVDQDAIVALL
jgi:hypothetical protein